MSHIYHPDTHTHGLCDECPRCEEHAATLTGLDAENLVRLWRGQLHTRTDVAAYNALYRSVVVTQRLGEAFAVKAWHAAGGSIENIGSGPDLRTFAKPDAFELFKVGGRA